MLNQQPFSRADLVEFLCSTIAEVSERHASEIKPDTVLSQVNMDSLTFVSVLSQVEAVYRVEFQPDEILDLFGADSIADLADSIIRIRPV